MREVKGGPPRSEHSVAVGSLVARVGSDLEMTDQPVPWIVRQWRRVRKAPTDIRNVGAASWAWYLFETKRRGRRGGPPRPLTARFAAHPLWFRPGSSDAYVFNQIFVEREYRCLDHLTEVDLVIDCGANVGYSSAYFMTRFPNCRVVAVEPDPGNFAALVRNLRPYGDRAVLVHSGVWSRPCGLVLSEELFGDGLEWSRQVRPCRPGEAAQMTATDIGTLVGQSGAERVSVLKVDVEGAEAVIFGENYEHWIRLCDNIVIELHLGDPRCAELLHRAIAGLPFETSRCGEVTVCTRPRRRTPTPSGPEAGR